MKNLNFTFVLLVINLTQLFAQLTGEAKTLYDSAYLQDPEIVSYALDNGAQIIATPDNNSFYIQWFPVGNSPTTSPIVVTLHGTECNAFMEFKSWYLKAKEKGCGIIALQWYRYNPNPPFDYFTDDILYTYIDSALRKINYPSNKALLHGFSRGSARSYAIIFNDIKSGNNYFCTTISNSGDANLDYPLYDSITNNFFGSNVFLNKHWNLYCGGLDTITYCYEMSNTKSWLQSQGAIIDIFIQDPSLGHNGFQLPSSNYYKDSILNNYLKCFNGTLKIENNDNNKTISIYPNPFSESITIKSNFIYNDAKLIIYDNLGKPIKQIDNIKINNSEINLKKLPKGIYFVKLFDNNNKFITCKYIIAN